MFYGENMRNDFIQTYIENNHLKYFIDTNTGKSFLNRINCVEIKKTEIPDYILKGIEDVQHGLEITVLYTEHPVCRFFSSMDNIVKKVFKKLHNDPEIESKFFINLICNENNIDVTKIKLKEDEIAQQIYLLIKKQPYTPEIRTSYEFNGLVITGNNNIIEFTTNNNVSMKLIYSTNDRNFGGTPVVNFPLCTAISLIQNCINKKDLKYNNYKKKCNGTCNLLLVADPFIAKGLLIETNENVYEHVFVSKFDNVFLLELGGKEHIKSSKLLISSV